MSSHTDDEWTILSPTASPGNMDATSQELPNKAEGLAKDGTVNVTSTVDDGKDNGGCSCNVKPILVRRDSIESIDEDYRRPRRAGRVPPPRRYTPSPHRYPVPANPFIYTDQRVINSSTQLLDKVGKEDGIMEVPFPARSHIYLTTYPFGNKDVKKWSWLFASGIEGEYLTLNRNSISIDGEPVSSVERVRQRRDHSPAFLPGTIDIPSVYLSRALDVAVVPETNAHSVQYLIVTQNRHRPAGSKLLVAESRQAAGVLMYYEILRGDSVLFVGATLHQCGTVPPGKYKKVATLEEAIRAREGDYVGIVC